MLEPCQMHMPDSYADAEQRWDTTGDDDTRARREKPQGEVWVTDIRIVAAQPVLATSARGRRWQLGPAVLARC